MPIDPLETIEKGRRWYFAWKRRRGALYGAKKVGKSTFIKTLKYDCIFPTVNPNTTGISKPIKIKTEVYGEGKTDTRYRKCEICDSDGDLNRKDLLRADLWWREPEFVIIMIDHTHISLADGSKGKKNNLNMVKMIVEAITSEEKLVHKKTFWRRKKYIEREENKNRPHCIALCINKLDEIIKLGLKVEDIWFPFREHLDVLTHCGIYNMVWATCAKNQRFEGSQIKEMMNWIFKKIEEGRIERDEENDDI